MDKYKKVPLNMPTEERQRLMDYCLQSHQILMKTFDMLEQNAISPHDVVVVAQLPGHVNTLITGLQGHITKTMGSRASRPVRQGKSR